MDKVLWESDGLINDDVDETKASVQSVEETLPEGSRCFMEITLIDAVPIWARDAVVEALQAWHTLKGVLSEAFSMSWMTLKRLFGDESETQAVYEDANVVVSGVGDHKIRIEWTKWPALSAFLFLALKYAFWAFVVYELKEVVVNIRMGIEAIGPWAIAVIAIVGGATLAYLLKETSSVAGSVIRDRERRLLPEPSR